MNKYFKIEPKGLKFEIPSPVSSHFSSPTQTHPKPPHDIDDAKHRILLYFYSPFSIVTIL